MSERLSIVIPSHNRVDLLTRCLESVLRHAPRGTEIIVVDDGSPQGIVSERVAGFAPAVRVERLPEQRGFCAAANACLGAATAPIVELLNDDTEVTAGWAEAALAHFQDGNVAAVAPLVLVWPGTEGRIDSAGDRYYLGGVAAKRGRGTRLADAKLQAGPVFGASASSAFYRRDAVLRVGAFAESFGAYFEDVDLSFRLHRAGGTIMFEPASRVLHRGHASYGTQDRPLLRQQSRNEELVFWRNIPARALWRAVPMHAAVLAAKALRRWREGTLGPFLCGRVDALRVTGAVVRHRRWLKSLGESENASNWSVDYRL